jgi:16S rRNA (guanine527-N7)-methyltransferase
MEYLVRGASLLGLELSRTQLEAFQLYSQELTAWNRKFNLTSITGHRAIQVRHFLDSISCTLAIADPSVETIDIGTGPGFPGLPLKILHPQMPLTLLESIRKKVRFLEHMVEVLELEGVEVIWGRAEEWGRRESHRERFGLALARAVAPMATLLEYALPFCRVGGTFIAQKGAKVLQELKDAGQALEILGGKLKEVRDLRREGLEELHSLVVVEKVAPTPPRYPRRPGIPSKRPLN